MTPRDYARAARRFAAILALVCSGETSAQTPGAIPGAIPVQTFSPAPPGDTFFTIPDARAPGHLVPAAGLVISYAHEPLILEMNHHRVPGGKLVREQVWGFAQASLGLGSRFRLDASLPVVLSQQGDHYFSSVPRVANSGLGDFQLGLLGSIARVGHLDLGAGLDLMLPTGSRQAYAGDGGVVALPKAVVGLEAGSWVYGAQMGVVLDRRLDVGYTKTGPGLAWGVGAAWQSGDFRIGPEAFGQVGFAGTRSPSQVMLGGHWHPSVLDVGLGLSTSIVRDAGASPLRALLTAAWRPGEVSCAPVAGSSLTETAAASAPLARAAPTPAPAPEAPNVPEPPAASTPLPLDVPTPQPEPQTATVPAPSPTPFTMRETVRFDLARHTIREADLQLLPEVVEALSTHPIDPVRVEGHTDSTGTRAFNLLLSIRRAATVRDWLAAHGVAKERISIQGLGPDQPVASNATRAGRIANRRVDILVQAR